MTTTTVSKGRDGWRAETRITLPDVEATGARGLSGADGKREDRKPGDTRLSITTWKRSGGLASFASVAFEDAQGFTTHAIGYGVAGCGDYSRTVLRSDDRCTERAVRRLHDEALTHLPAILEEARAHYAAQEAKRAADFAEVDYAALQRGYV